MNTDNMNRMLDNWVNGNRTTAKAQAKRTSAEAIARHLVNAQGWDAGNAWALTVYLKGADNYQAACDATAAELHNA